MNSLAKLIFVIALSLAASSNADAATTYLLSITNGGAMPLSPMVVYVIDGQKGAASIGQAPTTGFVQLCQTGNPTTYVQELKMDRNIGTVVQTSAPILPGETSTIEIEVSNPLKQSLHFESMYGKTKDACASGVVGSHSLYALKQHVTSEIAARDSVVQTGAYLDPVLPTSYSDTACSGAMTAVSCLRELALPSSTSPKIRFFNSYLPSVITFLETKYGAADAMSLNLPTSGAVQFQLKLKH